MGYETKIPKFIKGIKKWEIDALNAIGFFTEGAAKRNLTEQKAVDTGNLRSSVHFQVNRGKKQMILGTNVDYSIFVEKGTIKMTKRPYLTPAVEGNIKQIQSLVERVRMSGGS